MTHPYHDYLLPIAIDKLGNIFEQACLFERIDIDQIATIFVNSFACKSFETGDPIHFEGRSSAELLGEILNIEPHSYDQNQYATPEYWVGYVLAYAQWWFNVPYKILIDSIKPSDLINCYFPYHEMDIRHILDYIGKRLPKVNKLKELRMKKGYSQSDLSFQSNIPIRTIRAYEQGTIDLDKAQGDTLYALSQALNCTIEDLILKY